LVNVDYRVLPFGREIPSPLAATTTAAGFNSLAYSDAKYDYPTT